MRKVKPSAGDEAEDVPRGIATEQWNAPSSVFTRNDGFVSSWKGAQAEQFRTFCRHEVDTDATFLSYRLRRSAQANLTLGFVGRHFG